MKVDIDGKKFNVNISHQRRKTISLAVDPVGELIVKVPSHINDEQISKFINSRKKWINRRLDSIYKINEAGIGTLEPGRILYYRGVEYMLERTGAKICIKGNSILLPVNGGFDELEQWYSSESESMVGEFIGNNRIPSCTIKVKKQKQIWGSCNAGRRIYINSRISMCRPKAFEYIMWHEICHLRHMDHSKRFYRELERVCPDYKKEKKWLKEKAPYLSF